MAISGSSWRSPGESHRSPPYVELTESEEALVLASFDPLSSMAVVGEEQLRELLAEVTIDQEDLAALLRSLAPPPRSGLTDPDAVPDVAEEPYVQPGGLWLLGERRLLCGDATDAADVADSSAMRTWS